MKKTAFFLFFFCNLLFAQKSTLLIVYEETMVVDVTKYTTTINGFLVANTEASLYEEDFMKIKSDTFDDGEGNTSVTVKTNRNPKFYRSGNSPVTYLGNIKMRDFVVSDDAKFNWNIAEEQKEILGYTCQKATAEFRGRVYVAYFAPKLQFNAGPWKFNGLPGTILEVKSQDGAFSMTAKKLEVKNTATTIANPYKDAKIISYAEFKNIYKTKYEEMLSMNYGDGVRASMPKRQIETMIED